MGPAITQGTLACFVHPPDPGVDATEATLPEHTLDETEAEGLRGLAEMLRTHFGTVDEQPEPIKPKREDVVRLAQELPEDPVEAAWRALVALL